MESGVFWAILVAVVMVGGTFWVLIATGRSDETVVESQPSIPRPVPDAASMHSPAPAQSTQAARQSAGSGEGMRFFGGALLFVGVVAMVIAWMMSTSVEVPLSYEIGGYATPSEVSNLGKMQTQMMVLHSGIGSFLAGSVIFAAGALLEAIAALRD